MAMITAPAVAALLLLFWTAAYGDAGEYVLYKDASKPVEARVTDLLGRMTLAEKIGQMTQIERLVASPQVLKDNFIGSLLSGGGSVPRKQATAAEWMDMINEFQKACLSTRLGIPMIYGIDAVHGHNNVYGATIFPHNVALGATRDPELVKRIGAATALEVRATGIQYAFAPCIAVCRDPRWGRCYESYSEDHRIVQAMTELIPGLQGDVPQNFTSGMPYVAGKDKVAACAKHFVGDGGTQNGINENNTIIDRQGLMSIHMPAYLDSLRKGVSTVMISYSSWNGIKMHANHDLVTGFLKGKLNFKGFTISDWEGIDRITSPAGANYSYSVQASILAGLDMIMVPNNFQDFISILTGHVNNGIIPMSRIDDAVTRILRVKFTMGLFENPMADPAMADQLGKQEHRDIAREAVRKSLVLLKNGKPGAAPLLPLPKKAPKILVAGSHADNLGYQCGGWTIEWQGDTGRITVGTTILDAVKAAVDPSTAVVFAENPDADFVKNGGFSYAIVVVGEHPYTETKGDSMNLTIPDPGPSTVQTVCGAVKCATVLISGRPVVIQPFLGAADAFVAAWLPGSEGQGVTDVLFGDYGFTGKLPRTWFKSVDQLPMNYGDAHYDPLFHHKKVEKLIGRLSRAGGEAVYLEDHIFGLMDGVIGTVALGNIYGTDQFTHKKHFHDVLDEAVRAKASFSAEDYFPNAVGRLVDHLTGAAARREKVFRDLDAFFDVVIDQHLDPSRATPENGPDLIDVMVSLMKPQEDAAGSPISFTRDNIKGLLSNVFTASVDTSSVTMVWAMAELMKKPSLLHKVQQEIRAVVGNKERVQAEDMPKLKYLKMVVKETLRLHPAAPLLLPRETMRHVEICGYDVPAKTRLFVNAWAIGRDPATWDDPDEFHPDRFHGKDVDFNGTHFELLPFGAGRRMCPGMAMGVATTEFTLANLLYCFDWELPGGMTSEDISMEEAGGLTVHKKVPLVLVPIIRCK